MICYTRNASTGTSIRNIFVPTWRGEERARRGNIMDMQIGEDDMEDSYTIVDRDGRTGSPSAALTAIGPRA